MGSSASKGKKTTTAVKAAVSFKSNQGMSKGGKKGSSGEGWREILLKVADMDLWEGDARREERPAWKVYLQQAEDAVNKPRKPLAQVQCNVSVPIA